MLDGDQWQYGDPPTADELIRHAHNRSRLLAHLPMFATPVEVSVVDLSPNKQFVRLASHHYANTWYDISKIRIVDILPKVVGPLKPHTLGQL